MDPASVIGLIVSIQALLSGTYRVGRSAISAKEDVRTLALELTALKANLEHVQMIIDFTKLEIEDEDGESVLNTSNLNSPEFQQMLLSTQAILQDLHGRIQTKSNVANRTWQKLTWHIEKPEIEEYIKRLERAKSWFILAITSDNTAVAHDLYRRICGIEETLTLQTRDEKHQRELELHANIKKWLAPHNIDSIYQQCLEKLRPGTGDWFYNVAQKIWTMSTTSKETRLWFQAKPGFGKTILVAGAIDRAVTAARGNPRTPLIAYHFCSFTEQHSQDLRNILGSLVFQCCCSLPSLFDKVDNLYPSQKSTSKLLGADKLSRAQLEDLLVQVVEGIDRCCLFVDAVNESKDPTLLVETLNTILKRCDNVRILVTSTEGAALEAESDCFTVISAKKDTNAADIELYIDAWLSEHHRLRRLPYYVKRKIKCELQKNTGDVFRWVECQLQALCAQKSIKEILNALQQLPSTLEQTYHRVLENIRTEDRQLAKKLLLWLSFALRPMFFEEVCEAVILEDQGVDVTKRLLYPRDILEVCLGLISYDSRKRTLAIAHSSVFDFLTSDNLHRSSMQEFYLEKKRASTILAKHCLEYLLMPDLATGYIQNYGGLGRRLETWPLLSYIGDTLWDHLYYQDPHGPLSPLLLRFLASQKQPKGGSFGSWMQIYRPQYSVQHVETTTPLYWAAREGLLSLVQMILTLEGNESLERPGGMFASTPLHVASWAGHVSVVQELLAAGADANERNSEGTSGLYWAIVLGYPEIFKILKDAGAELDT